MKHCISGSKVFLLAAIFTLTPNTIAFAGGTDHFGHFQEAVSEAFQLAFFKTAINAPLRLPNYEWMDTAQPTKCGEYVGLEDYEKPLEDFGKVIEKANQNYPADDKISINKRIDELLHANSCVPIILTGRNRRRSQDTEVLSAFELNFQFNFTATTQQVEAAVKFLDSNLSKIGTLVDANLDANVATHFKKLCDSKLSKNNARVLVAIFDTKNFKESMNLVKATTTHIVSNTCEGKTNPCQATLSLMVVKRQIPWLPADGSQPVWRKETQLCSAQQYD